MKHHATLEEARKAPLAQGRRSALLIEHGSMQLRHYAPRGVDPQSPHTQDEVYIVANGRGWFFHGPQGGE